MQLNGRDERQRRPIVYLVPWYPAISPTFVLREVQALRRLGRQVSTMSIHRPRPRTCSPRPTVRRTPPPTSCRRRASATTCAAHWQAVRTRPSAYVSTLAAALRAGPMEPAVKARGLLYFCEAVVAWWHARRSGARHIHGVFAGPAADAAMLAARLGGEDWSWSLAAHGTDMLQIPRASLAAKIRSARFVTVSSDFGRSQLMVLVGQEHWPKIQVVHCGLDPTEYDGTPADRRAMTSCG